MSYDYTMPDGGTIKVVPEQDLMAIKSGAEKEKGELSAQMAELKSLAETAGKTRDETHTQLLQVQAAKEQLEEQLKTSAGYEDKSKGLEDELAKANASIGELSTKMLEVKRVNISQLYGVGVDTLATKTEEQLTSLEEALKLVGKSNKPASLDIGGGSGGTSTVLTGLEQCAQEIAEIRSK